MQWLSSLELCTSDGYPALAMTLHSQTEPGEKMKIRLPSSPICSFSGNRISPATLVLCGGIHK